MKKICEPEADERPTGILESVTFTDSEGDKFTGSNRARLVCP